MLRSPVVPGVLSDKRPGRLPGVVFRHEVPPLAEALPRMDVAGFVGLAERGPVGVPVPVEDPGRFRDVFGPDQKLAWDVEAGRTATAFLGPAVEAFFRNGGRRCWVVRVARGAAVSRFPLPWLVDAETGRPAIVDARCPGSWPDGRRVGPVLDARTLAAADFAPFEDGFRLFLPATETLRAGDTLRTTFTGAGIDVLLLLSVRAVRSVARRLEVTTSPGRVFRRLPPIPDSSIPVRANLLADDGTVRARRVQAVLEHRDGRYRLRLLQRTGRELARGALAHLEVERGPMRGRMVWLSVGSVDRRPLRTRPERDWTIASAAEVVWPVDEAGRRAAIDSLLLGSPEAARPLVERLAFELVVWDGRQVSARLRDLSPSRSEGRSDSPERLASRFWADLPTDDSLFRLVDGRSAPPVNALAQEAVTPRFPLAGPADASGLYLPLGMPWAADRENSRPPLDADPATALERDGLAAFGPGWLLDDDLAGLGIGALPGAVFDKLYVRDESLEGAHAFWPIEEVTLFSAPDAVQPGWARGTPPEPARLPAPNRPIARALATAGSFRLTWRRPAPRGGEYELEEATDPVFADRIVRYRGTSTRTYVYFGAEGLCGEDLGCVAPRHYRLRVRVGGHVSPWSRTLRLDPAPTGFRACMPPLAAPGFRLFDEDEPPRLRWTRVAGATGYVLEAAEDPAFGIAATPTLTSPTARSYRLEPLPERMTWYRVRAERSTVGADGSAIFETSPWSVTVRIDPPRPSRWIMRAPADYDAAAAQDLVDFQQTMLRLAAARGDLVALLALPAHYRRDEAVAHAAELARDLRDPEGSARSYGALYHPWVGVRDETGRERLVRLVPPDGAVTGMVAARALARGAWVAPANVALRDVVALGPDFDDSAWAELLDHGVNLIRPTPRGFLPLSADLLATGELRPLNVRRLLILLRRLALREGHAFAFESNSAALRRRVAMRFEQYLTRLFERGAFAGTRPTDGFEVRTDDTMNPPESVDRGRLIVELRVAPSQPLAFLTVRLVQLDGAGLLALEG